MSKFSLRAKFVDSKTIELVVIDHRNGSVFLHRFNFISGETEKDECSCDPEYSQVVADATAAENPISGDQELDQSDLIEEQLEEGE